MAVSYLAISAASTALSFAGLQFWTGLSLDSFRTDGPIGESIYAGNSNRAVELHTNSYATIALLANCLLNIYILLILCLKTIFFVELYPSENKKLLERLINYVIYKGTFLPLVVPPNAFQAGLWLIWLIFLCSLKMFQALARDRLERLNASPSSTPLTYLRVYSVLLLVLSADLFWIRLCLMVYKTLNSPILLLLFYEPCSIAFETMQALLVHGFQLLDVWIHHLAVDDADCRRSKYLATTAAGSLLEWKGVLIRDMGFLLDMATLIMALGHYLQIWWLHGMAFHLVDVVLFLNIRALLSAILKRMKGFIKLRIALGALHAALPDATPEELRAYDDECAICREPMAKAKRLHCSHLFHLSCLRSWLDQGLNDVYLCPTCRKPLFGSRTENEASPGSGDVSSDERLARQLDRQNTAGHSIPTGIFPSQTPNSMEGDTWRSAGLDPSWMQTWPNQGGDGAGPSTSGRSVRLGRVQMMMRHFASVGETYAQTTLEEAAWSLWPMNPAEASTSNSPVPPAVGGRHQGTGGMHARPVSRAANDNMTNILSMAETVREVLPHVPDELIFQDLQRTNSVTVTVNNLLQM